MICVVFFLDAADSWPLEFRQEAMQHTSSSQSTLQITRLGKIGINMPRGMYIFDYWVGSYQLDLGLDIVSNLSSV